MSEVKKETKTSGGGTEIKVDTKPVDLPQVAEEGEKEQPIDVAAAAEGNLVSEAMVETIVRVLGKTLAMVTKMPEMDFDEHETEQLKNLWSPLIPTLSPVAMAVIGTVVIAGGKVGVYMSQRDKTPTAQDSTSKDTKGAAESLEKSLDEEWKGK